MNDYERLKRAHGGSFEIMHCVGPNLVRGLVVSVMIHSALISIPVLAGLFVPDRPFVKQAGAGPVTIVPPTPFRPQGGSPIVVPRPSRSAAGTRYVPADEEPVVDTTVADQPVAVGSGGAQTGEPGDGLLADGGGGDLTYFLPPEDVIPPDTVFIPVEILPQALPGFCPWPDYPEVGKIARLEGKVAVNVWVDRTGTVRKWVVVQANPSGFGFEDEVLKVVPQWKFTPAVQQGRAIGVWVTLPFKFRFEK